MTIYLCWMKMLLGFILWQKYDDHNVAFIFNEKEKDVIMTIFNGYNPYYG